jgi:hypothetical protein
VIAIKCVPFEDFFSPFSPAFIWWLWGRSATALWVKATRNTLEIRWCRLEIRSRTIELVHVC